MRFLHRVPLSFALIALVAQPCLAQSGSFGSAVVVGADELIIAEPNTYFRPGTVYVYRKSGNAWREAAQLRAPSAERSDGFGTGLALAGNTLFIAQRGGRLHTFRKDGSTWRAAGTVDLSGIELPDPECNQYGYCDIGSGVALAAAGDWLLIGEPGEAAGGGGRGGGAPAPPAPAGEVHAFQRAADGWVRRASFSPADGRSGDRFGAAIALVEGRALIGAPNWSAADGAPAAPAEEAGGGRGERPLAESPGPRGVEIGRVYEFRLDGDAWRETAQLDAGSEPNATFGATIALQGDTAVIGAPGSGGGHGAAFVFRRDPASGVWSEQSRLAAFDGRRGDRFGSAVALDGRDVWVGAPAPWGTATGLTYVYRGRANEPLLEGARRLRLEETVTRDAFGDRIVARGGVAAVSATGMHHQSGAVYVYERDAAGDWQDRGRLVSAADALAPVVGEERKCPPEGKVGPFDCKDVELLAFVPSSMLRAGELARGVRTNDNWGWTDPETGREYALVGRNDGTSFIDITDPTNPVLVGDLPKTPDTPPSQLWRDMKVYKDHVFVVADGAGNHGMQVFDLRRLRNVPDKPALFEPDAHYPRVASVHNIAINEETGFAFLVGSRGGGETCGGGLHMVDIRQPLSPTFAGCFRPGERGTHDTQCAVYQGPDQRYRGREICLNSNGSVFEISDVTDKASPRMLATVSHPNPAYLHQGWLTEDHKYFFMDDESDVIRGNVPTTRTLVWDVSDLEDPKLAKEFMGSMPASAHNQYVIGNFSYQANYRYGLHVLDISDPENPREVGHFDTSPYQTGPGFSGAWSTYPFFKSGTVVVTSLQEGVFFLKKRPTQVFD